MTVGICDVIAEAWVTSLTADCQTAIASTDATYVDTVKAGRLNATPQTTHGNHICIHNNDPRDPVAWRDITSMISPMDYPARVLRGTSGVDDAEVGGGIHWWRRFTIEVLCHYTHLDYSQDAAREYANTVFQRVMKSLRDNIVTGSDNFDEAVSDVFPKVRWQERSEKGEGTDWIWQAFLGVEVYTYVL